MSFVAAINEGVDWQLTRELLHLVKLVIQSVAAVRVIWTGLDAHHEAFLVGHGQAHLPPELIRLAAPFLWRCTRL